MIKEKLLNLLQVGRTNDVLERLLWLTNERNPMLYNELILLSSQLNANNSMYNMNIMAHDDLKIETNKIAKSLLSYIEEVANADYVQEMSLSDLENGIHTLSEGKIKILFIASNPIGTSKFQLEKEYLDIRRIFNSKRSKFEVVELFNASIESLFDAVRIEKPDILHLSGPANNDFFYFHRQNDTIRTIPYHFLAPAFSMFQPYVKCVFINTQSSPIFLKKISNGLHFAIGGNNQINDEISILFSNGFYTAVSQGKSYDEAFQVGLETLKSKVTADASGLMQRSLYGSNITETPPFVLFKDGISSNPNDQTPEEFEVEDPVDSCAVPRKTRTEKVR